MSRNNKKKYSYYNINKLFFLFSFFAANLLTVVNLSLVPTYYFLEEVFPPRDFRTYLI